MHSHNSILVPIVLPGLDPGIHERAMHAVRVLVDAHGSSPWAKGLPATTVKGIISLHLRTSFEAIRINGHLDKLTEDARSRVLRPRGETMKPLTASTSPVVDHILSFRLVKSTREIVDKLTLLSKGSNIPLLRKDRKDGDGELRSRTRSFLDGTSFL